MSVAYIVPLSRTKRHIGRLNVTRDSIGHHFKVKRSKVNLQGGGILWRPATYIACSKLRSRTSDAVLDNILYAVLVHLLLPKKHTAYSSRDQKWWRWCVTSPYSLYSQCAICSCYRAVYVPSGLAFPVRYIYGRLGVEKLKRSIDWLTDWNRVP